MNEIDNLIEMYDKLSDIDDIVYITLSETFLAELKRNTPAKTHKLRNSWRLEKVQPYVYAFVNPMGDIIYYLELGTRPHFIRPKTKKFLKFEINDSFSGSGKYRGKVYPIVKGNFVMWINKVTRKMEFGVVYERGKKYLLIKQTLHPGFEGRHFLEKTFTDKALFEKFNKLLDKRLRIYLQH